MYSSDHKRYLRWKWLQKQLNDTGTLTDDELREMKSIERAFGVMDITPQDIKKMKAETRKEFVR